MAAVVLFHHAVGLTPGVVAFADDLRHAGHTVHTPDLFEGRTFATIDEGVAYAQQVGFGEVIERGVRATDALPEGLVYAGFSLGVLPAQKLVRTPSPTAPCRRTTPRPLPSYSSGCSTFSVPGKGGGEWHRATA
jgi:dienelactone hydrolase